MQTATKPRPAAVPLRIELGVLPPRKPPRQTGQPLRRTKKWTAWARHKGILAN